MSKFKLTSQHVQIARKLLSAVLLFLAGGYVYVYRDELVVLFTIHWWDVAKLAGVIALYNLTSATQFASLYRVLGAEMSIWESFGLSSVATALNTILPAQPGSVARAMYLKHQYAIPYSQVPVIYLGALIFPLLIGALITVLSNTVASLMGQSVPLALWLGAVGAGAPIILFWITVPEWMTARLGRIGNMLRLFSDGWKSLRGSRRCLVEMSVYQLLRFAIGGVAITFAYQSLGMSVNPLVGIAMVVFMTLSNLVIITPGNLGIREAIIGYLSQLSGLTFVQGVAASTLLRVVGLVVNFTIAPVSWYLLFFRQDIHIAKSEQT